MRSHRARQRALIRGFQFSIASFQTPVREPFWRALTLTPVGSNFRQAFAVRLPRAQAISDSLRNSLETMDFTRRRSETFAPPLRSTGRSANQERKIGQ